MKVDSKKAAVQYDRSLFIFLDELMPRRFARIWRPGTLFARVIRALVTVLTARTIRSGGWPYINIKGYKIAVLIDVASDENP